jgi:hypothetical protein
MPEHKAALPMGEIIGELIKLLGHLFSRDLEHLR